MDKYLLPEDDGLSIRVFHKWTRQKLDYLERYIINMFETSMRQKKWCARCYVDLFVGKGALVIKIGLIRNGTFFALAINLP